MTTPCTHGMPTPASCFTCMEDGNIAPPPPKPRVVTERIFTAVYDGHCRACNLPITPGHTIALMTDGTYRHESCAP